MFKMVLNSIIFGVILLANLPPASGVGVSNTNCTQNGTECPVHSMCVGAKCKCDEGFSEKALECVADESDSDCTVSGNECPVNAMCVGKECKCDDGFSKKADECEADSGAASTMATTGIVFGSMWILWNIMSII